MDVWNMLRTCAPVSIFVSLTSVVVATGMVASSAADRWKEDIFPRVGDMGKE